MRNLSVYGTRRAEFSTKAHRLTGLQIRELGPGDRVRGFKTEIVSGHVRVIGDATATNHIALRNAVRSGTHISLLTAAVPKVAGD